jgi:hypothetical protein
MLLACMGDDGQPCAAQQLGTLKGKIIRLDVSEMPGAGPGPPPKSDITPPDNPFSGPGDNERLVYAWGVRNPFRFTIDPETGDVVIGDVGQEFREEVDFMPVIQAGANFGWPIREGDVQGCCPTCPIGSAFTEPIYAYPHGGGPQAVIAGPLLRIPDGALFSFPGSYDGSIFFAEFYEGWIRRMVQVDGVWQFAPQVPGQPSALNWAQGMPSISDFQMGADGAIYFCKISGVDRGVYRIRTSIPLDAELGGVPSTLGMRVAVDPTPVRAGSGARIAWSGAQGPVSLSIVDAAGRRVASLVHGDVRNAGHLQWDGRTSSGSALPAGVYFVRLTSGASPAASSKLIVVR